MADATTQPHPERKRKRPAGPVGEGGFYDVESACVYLGVSRTRFWQWRNAGWVPDKGRWTREELDAVNVPRRRRQSKKSERAEADAAEHAPTVAPPAAGLPEVQGDPWSPNLPAKKKAAPEKTAGAAVAPATEVPPAPGITPPVPSAPAVPVEPPAAAPAKAGGFWDGW